MNTINIIKNNLPHASIDVSKILDGLLASDKPYYVNLKEDLNTCIITCIYIHDKENKTTIALGNTQISIGNISGKVYEYITETSNMIDPLKFKDKIKEEFNTYKNDLRFKTNVNAFLNLLSLVILQKS